MIQVQHQLRDMGPKMVLALRDPAQPEKGWTLRPLGEYGSPSRKRK